MGEHLLSLLWRLIKAKTQRQAVPTDRDAQLKAVCTFRRLEDRVTFAPTTWAPPQTSTSTADFIFPSEYSSRTITNCGPPSTSLVWATRLRSSRRYNQATKSLDLSSLRRDHIVLYPCPPAMESIFATRAAPITYATLSLTYCIIVYCSLQTH